MLPTRHPPRFRPRRQPGPALTPPAEPRSGKHRRHLIKVACWRLGRLTRRPASRFAEMDDATLCLVASGLTPVHGRNAQGKARRLVAKIIRLRPDA